jgi:hypothetical protein
MGCCGGCGINTHYTSMHPLQIRGSTKPLICMRTPTIGEATIEIVMGWAIILVWKDETFEKGVIMGGK